MKHSGKQSAKKLNARIMVGSKGIECDAYSRGIGPAETHRYPEVL